jgi:hypothetical protein
LDGGAPPWAPALRFWRDVSQLRRRGWLAAGAPVAPRRAALHACLAALPALWRSRAAVTTVAGVDVSPANALLRPPCGGAHASDTHTHLAPPFAVQLFQCADDAFVQLSPPVALAALDFACADWTPLAGTATLAADAAGEADALLLWVSYEGGTDSADADDALSGAPRRRPDGSLAPCAARQAVALLRAPRGVRPGDAAALAWRLDEDLQLSVEWR